VTWQPQDLVRILILLASLVGLGFGLYNHRRGITTAANVMVMSWAAHEIIFYSTYYFSLRWATIQPDFFENVIRLWPPVLVFQAALSVAILQLSTYITGRNEL